MIAQAQSKFVPINPPPEAKVPSPPSSTENLTKNIPIHSQPRFNYDSYMKQLNERISGNAPN